MRTKEEQIKYFEWLAEEYATDAAREENKISGVLSVSYGGVFSS